MAPTVTAGPALPFPLQGPRVRIEPPGDGGVSPIVRLADGVAVGELVLEREGSQLTIRALSIDDAHRSYGCGSETGWLTVRAAEAAGFQLLRAWAPPDLGLAVYFWFRMGFRPVHGEGPEGGIWLERRVPLAIAVTP